MSELRKLREQKGLRREFIANKLEISPDHLSNIERGQTPLKLTQIKILAKAYDIDFGEMAEIALATIERRSLNAG